MAHTPLAVSTATTPGFSGGGDLGVSPETIQQVHLDELRLLRSGIASSASVTVLSAIAWIALELLRPGSPLSFLLGLTTVHGLFRTAAATRRWWSARQRDPIAAALEAEANRARAADNAAAHAARLAAHPPYATNTLVVVLIAIALVEFLAVGSVPRAVAAAGLVKNRVVAGEWWRLLTAAFLHGSGFHLWANISALLVFGRIVEAYSTRSRFLLAYETAVVTGNLLSCWLLPQTPSIGASGGILGLVGFVYALSRQRPTEVPRSLGQAAIATMTLTGLVGAVGFRFIDNAAHAGGAVAGVLVAWLTVPRELAPAERSAARCEDDRVVSLIGAIAAIVLAAGGLLTGAKVFAARSTDVTHVRAEIQMQSDGASVVLENLKDTPLEAYTLEVYDSNFPVFRQWRDERGFDYAFQGIGPLAPHERRSIVLGDTRQRLAHPSVRIVAAAFGDGTFEGSAADHDTIDERRANTAADADYWIGVIDETLAKPPDQVAAFLNAKIGERARANAAAHRSSDLGSAASLLSSATQRPERFAADAAAERARLVKRRDALQSSVR